jgi:hypothetical protein
MVPSASIMKCADRPQPCPLGRGRLCIDLKHDRELTQPSKCSTSCEIVFCSSGTVRSPTPLRAPYRLEALSQQPPFWSMHRS